MLGLRNPGFVGGLRFFGEGGIVSDISVGTETFRVHRFTSSGTFTAYGFGPVQYLIIGGGGGGAFSSGGNSGGGGSSGGYLTSVPGQLSGRNTPALAVPTISSGSYSVVVGNGGNRATAGGSSSIFGVTAFGGNPGSGRNGGSVPSNQGFNGGSGDSDGVNPASSQAGGGGGAGSAGTNGVAGVFDGQTPIVNPISGNGGAGISSNITGTNVGRAGGGGGGTGGSGGGSGGASVGNNGAANTGGGGGGSSVFDIPPGVGGSGIVIVRYRIA
jgi:hypothetical protein